MSLSSYEIGLQIDSSKGMAHLNRMYYRSFTLNIFVGNTNDIQMSLVKNSDAREHIKLLTDRNKERELVIFREVARLFHNFLASAMTLVDHTRVFIEEFYLGTDVNRTFKSIVQREFAENELTSFVQDLRNYMMHRGMPPITRTLSFVKTANGADSQAEISTEFSLDVDDLRRWKKWRSNSRTYMENSHPKISLQLLVNEYHSVISKFHNKLDEIIHEHHKEDLMELYQLRLSFTRQHVLEGGLIPGG